MKVLSYNILAGGFSGCDYSLKQPERLRNEYPGQEDISDAVSLN